MQREGDRPIRVPNYRLMREQNPHASSLTGNLGTDIRTVMGQAGVELGGMPVDPYAQVGKPTAPAAPPIDFGTPKAGPGVEDSTTEEQNEQPQQPQ